MLRKLCLISFASLVFSGCTSQQPQQQKYQFVNETAHQCATEIRDQSAKLSAEGHSLSLRWTTVPYVVSPPDNTLRVDYVTSSILDNGVPGSAWKSCMQKKDALVPELRFSSSP